MLQVVNYSQGFLVFRMNFYPNPVINNQFMRLRKCIQIITKKYYIDVRRPDLIKIPYKYLQL